MSKEINNQSFQYLLNYILKKWPIFVLAGFFGCIAGILYAQLQKPQYESHLTFALDESKTGISGALDLAAQFGLNIGGTSEVFSGDNIIPILKSRRTVENVFLTTDSFDNKVCTLAQYFLEAENGKSKSNSVTFPPGVSEQTLSSEQRSVLWKLYTSFLQHNLVAQRPDRKLAIYEVNIISGNEKFSKVFTERLVSETDTFYIHTTTEKARQTMQILANRVTLMKDTLNSSISNKATAQDVNLNPAFMVGQIPLLMQQSNIQVYGAAYVEMFKNLELATYQYLNQVPLLQVIDSASYPMKKIKPSKLATGLWFAYFFQLIVFFYILIYKVVKYTATGYHQV